MTVNPSVPTLDALISADREAVDALLQFIGSGYNVDRHKQFADSYALQQCLLQLHDSTGQGDLLTVVNTKLEALETLSPRQAGAISLSEQFATLFFNLTAFNAELAAQLKTLDRKIAASALDGNGWLYNPQHPLRTVLNQLYAFACGWHSGLGRSAETSLQFLQSLLSAVQLNWQPCQQSFNEWLHTEQQRVQKLEQRLIASEIGVMKARRSRQLAVKTLNQLLSGKKLPPTIIDFIHGAWFQSLQLALIQGGERGELWFRQRKLTETLIWSLQPIKDDTHRQQLFRVVGQIGDELRDTLISLAHQVEAKDDALAIIENLHLQLIQNVAIDYSDVPKLDNNDPLLDTGTSISQSLLAKVDALQTGAWFDFPHQPQQRRLKLLIKHDEGQQLLFVNQLGIKALEQSFEEFAYQLASGSAVALKADNPFDEIWLPLLTTIQADMLAVVEQATRLAAEQRIKNAAEQRARELARVKAEEEAAALLAAKERAEKQRQEAALLAEQQRRNEALAAQGADEAERMQRARLTVSSLTIGAWMEWHSATGNSEKLKLAVILPTSGKCIFVDRNGIKKLELLRDELISSITTGELALINSGKQFEDTLARVVGGLRRDRNS